MNILLSGNSNVGRKRKNNEDHYLVFSPPLDPDFPVTCVFLVADGMGGHAAGEVASKAVGDYFSYIFHNKCAQFAKQNNLTSMESILEKLILDVNDSLYEPTDDSGDSVGKMGTTLTVGVVLHHSLYIGQVGDSRAYLVRDNLVYLLTEDQTLVNEHLKAGLLTEDEAMASRNKNILSQAVGATKALKPVIYTYDLFPHDRILLCSDGLHRHVESHEILDILKRPVVEPCNNDSVSTRSLDALCEQLIELANHRGGKDNITVVLAQVNP